MSVLPTQYIMSVLPTQYIMSVLPTQYIISMIYLPLSEARLHRRVPHHMPGVMVWRRTCQWLRDQLLKYKVNSGSAILIVLYTMS